MPTTACLKVVYACEDVNTGPARYSWTLTGVQGAATTPLKRHQRFRSFAFDLHRQDGTYHHTRCVYDPASRPVPSRIRLSWFLPKHLLQSILAAKPDASCIDGPAQVEVFGRELVSSLRVAIVFIRLERDASIIADDYDF